jgi:hypothetical protein
LEHLIHTDVRGEQHGVVDVNGDGNPEIFGACKGCNPTQRKGYYAADWGNPVGGWTFHPVTREYEFPYGGTGLLNGFGFGDVDGDGQPDLLERDGIWIDALGATPNELLCPAAGCGFASVLLYSGDASGAAGPAHMFAFDVDGDDDVDIVSADITNGYGLSWYEQTVPLQFVKRRFLSHPSEAATYGPVSFSQAHALQVADMDGDGVPDLVTGKTHFATISDYQAPDIHGEPVSYVFKTRRATPSAANGGSVTFEPYPLDATSSKAGVGREIAVGHVNTDGILDVCIASKLGLYLYLGN